MKLTAEEKAQIKKQRETAEQNAARVEKARNTLTRLSGKRACQFAALAEALEALDRTPGRDCTCAMGDCYTCCRYDEARSLVECARRQIT